VKRKILIGTLIAAFGLPLTAMASDLDCFPMCAEPAKIGAVIEPAADAANDWAPGEIVIIVSTQKSCDAGFVKTAEDLNDKVKPIREIVGYVRSPQGLVIKIVNDHIVKIPAWIGYVVDPLGSLKHQAIDEVRTRAKEAMDDGSACATVPANGSADATDAIDSKHSI
jgi:hypothetical protein